MSIRRELILIGESLVHTAYDSPIDASPAKQIEAAEAQLYVVAPKSANERPATSFADAAEDAIKAMNEAYQRGGGLAGLPTGLVGLDENLGGLRPGNVVIIAGRPGMGKIALAVNIAQHVAGAGTPVAFYSLEMSRSELATRILSSATGVSSWEMIAYAAWKQHRTCVSGRMMTLERGQVVVGREHLAAVWGWSSKQVRTFLAELRRENMINMGQSEGRIANVATICNYDKYQSPSAAKGQLTGQIGASSGPVKGHTVSKGTKGTKEGDAPAKRPSTSKTGIPATWSLDDEDRDYARKRGHAISDAQLANEGDKFRNHHLKVGSQFADWRAAWRTWVGSEIFKKQYTRRAADGKTGEISPDVLRNAARRWVKHHKWDDQLGPKPGEPNSRVLPAMLAEMEAECGVSSEPTSALSSVQPTITPDNKHYQEFRDGTQNMPFATPSTTTQH